MIIQNIIMISNGGVQKLCFVITHGLFSDLTFYLHVVLWLENNGNNLKTQVLILLVSQINFMFTQILIFIRFTYILAEEEKHN